MGNESNKDVAITLCEGQSKEMWNWSRFYHESEIKTNTGSLVITVLTMLVAFSERDGSVVITPVTLGALIIVVSLAAIVSTIGYWRYYELCDVYSKKFRKEAFAIANCQMALADVKKATKETFGKNYTPIAKGVIGRFFENAHHVVWIVTQLVVLIIGVRVIVPSENKFISWGVVILAVVFFGGVMWVACKAPAIPEDD